MFAVCGCRSVVHHTDATIPPGYYLVVGHVNKPGLIECGVSEKTLRELIEEAGGAPHGDSLDHIEVSYSGKTNFFSLNQNPQLPCGARVRVRIPLFDVIH